MDAEKLKKANSIKYFPLDGENSKIRIEYYYSKDGKEEFLDSVISYSTETKSICSIDIQIDGDSVLKNELFARFYTTKEHATLDLKSTDWLFISPELPIEKINSIFHNEKLLLDLAFPKIKSFLSECLAPDYKYIRIFKLKSV
ncbi:MAG: hypothetical protein MUC49_02195 [Raineya sp.]|jgi:hypothetical protein|nr:hypothetical protein [Raineya sp.]